MQSPCAAELAPELVKKKRETSDVLYKNEESIVTSITSKPDLWLCTPEIVAEKTCDSNSSSANTSTGGSPTSSSSSNDECSSSDQLTPSTGIADEHQRSDPPSLNLSDTKDECCIFSDALAPDSDQCEVTSTETVDIASLPASPEENENVSSEFDTEEDSTEREENSSPETVDKKVDDTELPLAADTNRWGENRRRKSLMMKYALQNSLDAPNSHHILTGQVGEVVKANGGCGQDCFQEPNADVYAWASSCANLNPVGPRFKLIREGDVQICYLDHTRTVISKILSFKFLRHFESHHLYLGDTKIYPRNRSVKVTDTSLHYSQISEVYVVPQWDQGQKYFLRIVVPHGSFLIQANNMYTRDQWYYSIMWKLHIFKYRSILRGNTKIDVLLKELKNFVEFVKTTPVQDYEDYNIPIEIISTLIKEMFELSTERNWQQSVIVCLSPLLEQYRPSPEMCRLFSDHCRSNPQSFTVQEAFNSSVNHILIHNVDFGKYPFMRKLLQDYIKALDYHSDREEALRQFVTRSHGSNYECPHPRVMPNLVSSCLAAIVTVFEEINEQKLDLNSSLQEPNFDDPVESYRCYLRVLELMAEYNDWLPGLANMLQPIPIHVRSLSSEFFVNHMGIILEYVAKDSRCSTHSQLLGSRVEKNGWFDIYCPVNSICFDEGILWSTMVDTLLNCCSRRKAFVMKLYEKQLESCLLLAIRGNVACQSALCLMLEWNLVKESDQQMLITTTLRATKSGTQQYEGLCKRQQNLKLIQKKGGPSKLTLPCRATDNDLAQLVGLGSFGNLERLTLAFTHITNSCAETLIKLPSLKYLNLWATKFGDEGLMVISEHLTNLQALNLCETKVTDKGIAALTNMTNLRWLNLNSTKLSALMLEELRVKLPHLNELDVRYTDAW